MGKKSKSNNVKKSYQDYWLYFLPGDCKLQNWFCRDYGHVVILTKELNKWVFIDPTPWKLKITLQDVKGSRINFLRTTGKFQCLALIKITINLNKMNKAKKIKYKWWHLFLPRIVSCVSIVEYVLGIKSNAYTPRGLARYLKRIKDKCPIGIIEKITLIT